jgi:hypothetical protein
MAAVNASEKVNLIRDLMKESCYKDLLELILGISKHNVSVGFESEPPLKTVKLVSAVRSHLEFLDLFGSTTAHQIVDGMHYFAYPDRFQEWLDADAPGVNVEELRRLRAHVR